MDAWKLDQGIPEGGQIEFFADTQSSLTTALGLRMDHPGPNSKLGKQTMRGKRAALYVVDNIIKHIEVSEGPDDPAGDDDPSSSCVDNMLEKIKAL